MTKKAYTIPCASAFRDAVLSLAERRGVNAGDIARSVLLVVPMDDIRDYPDPGDPRPEDREVVILKSGAARGRPWRRKPRLQVRMASGYDAITLRRALAIALAMETPYVPPSNRWTLSGGYGYFEDQNALSVAGAIRANEYMQFSAGVGVGLDSDTVGARAGFSISR